MIDGLAAHLFRRREQRRADERSGAREAAIEHQRFGQAKVADLDSAIGLHEAIRRLDVAVDDAQPVRLPQAVDDIENLGDCLPRPQGTVLGDEIVERGARHQLHDDVRSAGFLLGRQHKNAARMGDGAGEPAFTAEAFQGVGRAGVFGQQELQCHAPPRGDFLRFVNCAHAAGAQNPDQVIAAHGFQLGSGLSAGSIGLHRGCRGREGDGVVQM